MSAAGGDHQPTGEDNSEGAGIHNSSNASVEGHLRKRLNSDGDGELQQPGGGAMALPPPKRPACTISVRTSQSDRFAEIVLEGVTPAIIEDALRTVAGEQSHCDANVLCDQPTESTTHTFCQRLLQYEPALTVGGKYIAKDSAHMDHDGPVPPVQTTNGGGPHGANGAAAINQHAPSTQPATAPAAGINQSGAPLMQPVAPVAAARPFVFAPGSFCTPQGPRSAFPSSQQSVGYDSLGYPSHATARPTARPTGLLSAGAATSRMC